MKVGPALIEKEPERQMWKVSLTLQHMSYFTHWYSSHLYTPKEAIEKWMADTTVELSGERINYVTGITIETSVAFYEILEQVKIALIFLEAQE